MLLLFMLLLFMYKCKQLIIFLSLYVSRLSGATAIIDAIVPVEKKHAVSFVDEIAVQLPNFAMVFVLCQVPVHSKPRTAHLIRYMHELVTTSPYYILYS